MNDRSTQPPLIPPPPPLQASQKKSSSGCLLGTLIAFGCCLFFGALLVLVIAMVAVSGSGATLAGSAPATDMFLEHTLEHGSSSDKIVVIKVHGIIMSQDSMYGAATSNALIAQLRKAANDSNVKAIVLDMNTPGGEVTATDEVHHEIQKLRKEHNIKVITCMRSMAASGGYYLAAGTDHIVANRLTFTGSIGVIIHGYNVEALMDRFGIEPQVYKSGPKKDIMSMSRPATLPEQKLMQKLVDESFDEFAKIVADGRGLDKSKVSDRNGMIGDGRVMSGREAKNLGLVDELGYMEDAITAAKTLGGATNARVVGYQHRPTLANILMGAKSPEPDALSTISKAMPTALPRGQLYFLAPSAL